MTSRHHIRIAGVVKIMNRVRAQWNAGIAPSQAGEFRRMVQAAVREVEEICKAHKIKPAQLPAPTARAYAYLKNLDVNHLPSPAGPAGSLSPSTPAKELRIGRLVSKCKALQASFDGYAQKAISPVPAGELLERIRSMAASVEAACREAHASPLDLPPPSRRAYLWIEFLSSPANLERHLTALVTVQAICQALEREKKTFLKFHSTPVQVEFGSLPALYRARMTKGVLRITIHEGYIAAPRPVLEALIGSALGNARRGSKRTTTGLSHIRDYAQSASFRSIAAALERGERLSDLNHSSSPADADGGPHALPSDPRLEAVFQRVNDAYFGGSLPMPHLVWNRTITHHKLGHYQEATDTVMISLALDHPQVPEYVLEFVMYHELLHKKLGMQVRNGRRYAHTRLFREEERRFRQYDQASAFLDNLGKNL